MKKKLLLKTACLIFWILFFVEAKADSSDSYIFEEGGIDVSGGFLKSENYLLDHHSLTYAFRDNFASSKNYHEITGNSALQVFCGNNIVEPGEECDDGNLTNWDGCSSFCSVEPAVCGNWLLEFEEECDDGNLTNWDGCSNFCMEEAENGEGSSGFFFFAQCGNGKVEWNEECDDGNKESWDGCSKSCHFEQTLFFIVDEILETECGNGIFELEEECDDGNVNNGDGCDLDCKTEEKQEKMQEQKMAQNSVAKEEKKVQETIEINFEITECGNGIVEKGERCDDWNKNNGDGCSYRCRIEPKKVESKIPEDNWLNEYIQQNVQWPGVLEETEADLHEVAPIVVQKVALNLFEILFLIGLWVLFLSDLSFDSHKKKLFKIFRIK